MAQPQDLKRFERDPLIVATKNQQVMEAQELARRNGVHHMPVVDGGKLVGAVCTCDMMHCPPDTLIESIMHEPVTLASSAKPAQAAELMIQRSVGSVLLVENERAVGIVTRGEIVKSELDGTFDAQALRCDCCGSTEHLRKSDEGAQLCNNCQIAAAKRRHKDPH